MAEVHGTVLESFENAETGQWHLIVEEDEHRGTTTVELLAADPGFRRGDRVYRRTGLRQRASPWRPVGSG